MRKIIAACLATMLTLTFVSCGGDGPGLAGGRNGSDDGSGGDDTTATVDSVSLLASSPQLSSDGSDTVTLSVMAKDDGNRTIAGVPVTFSSTAGTLNVIDSTTTEQGLATAELFIGGDPTNRDIVVTALAGDVSESITISVIGSSLQIQGPSSLVNGDSGTFTLMLVNSSGTGIANRTIDVSSTSGNSLSAATLTTDHLGRATFTVTGTVAGSDTLTATALPGDDGNPTVSTTAALTVSNDNFRFTTPASGTEIDLGTNQTITVSWLDSSGAPASGETIRFASTRGSLSASTAVTDAAGEATVSISSTTSGPAVVSATNSDNTTTQLEIEFVATTPDLVSLLADPGVIGTNESSTITAIVQDANNNRVKNAIVEFTLSDTTGGSLSTASVITDSSGRAQTVYTASSETSADDGVVITGRVVGTALQASTSLTVSGSALFIVFGTGNSIIEDENDTAYTKVYSLFVSDSSGSGVANTNVNIRMLPVGYYKGFLEDTGGDFWTRNTTAACDSEDENGNGVLDTTPVTEDLNGDNELTPGNVAVVTPGTVTTDANGQAIFEISYPQNYAMWVVGRITASATVAGTESRKTAGFGFPASAADLAISNAPPNPVSPWGISASCSDTL